MLVPSLAFLELHYFVFFARDTWRWSAKRSYCFASVAIAATLFSIIILCTTSLWLSVAWDRHWNRNPPTRIRDLSVGQLQHGWGFWLSDGTVDVSRTVSSHSMCGKATHRFKCNFAYVAPILANASSSPQ